MSLAKSNKTFVASEVNQKLTACIIKLYCSHNLYWPSTTSLCGPLTNEDPPSKVLWPLNSWSEYRINCRELMGIWSIESSLWQGSVKNIKKTKSLIALIARRRFHASDSSSDRSPFRRSRKVRSEIQRHDSRRRHKFFARGFNRWEVAWSLSHRNPLRFIIRALIVDSINSPSPHSFLPATIYTNFSRSRGYIAWSSHAVLSVPSLSDETSRNRRDKATVWHCAVKYQLIGFTILKFHVKVLRLLGLRRFTTEQQQETLNPPACN